MQLVKGVKDISGCSECTTCAVFMSGVGKTKYTEKCAALLLWLYQLNKNNIKLEKCMITLSNMKTLLRVATMIYTLKKMKIRVCIYHCNG